MTTEEKREALQEFCDGQCKCKGCALYNVSEVCDFSDCGEIEKCYNIVFGGEPQEDVIACFDCQFYECDEEDFPCNNCTHNRGNVEHFEPINSGTTPEEINHPDRYAGGKFECIDVMLDVFGKDSVMHFCKLNAFKYLWRAEKKNGIEDIKKAVWYLNKFIELGGEE